MENIQKQDQALELFFRVNKSDVYFYQFVFEGYDNVGLVSAYKNGEIIRVLTTKDQKEIALKVINSLKDKVDFEMLDNESAEKIKYWFRINNK